MPADLPDGTPTFQPWHEFDATSAAWTATDSASSTGTPAKSTSLPLVLATWNVDSGARLPEQRISALISRILSLRPSVDVIFLQEVSKPALRFLLGDPRIQQHWISSEADTANFEGHLFISVALLSRARFGHPDESPGKATLGRVWRVKYPSRYGRDALCCDVFLPSSASSQEATITRVRLINVHLDSLAVQPSRRPQQLSIASSLLQSAGRGLVAGDFNPVLPEDETLIGDNHLVDAWSEAHPDEPGFTWGVDGKAPYPPNRMDKIAVLGLKVESVDILHPDVVGPAGPGEALGTAGTPSSGQEDNGDGWVSWSDHSGLCCLLQLASSSHDEASDGK